MWTLFTLLLLIGLMAYFMFFWSPDDPEATVVGPSPGTSGQTSSTFNPPSRALHFDSEKKWYGLSFNGYHEEYCFSTSRTPGEALESARVFFTNRRAKVVSEDGCRLLFCKDWDIFKFLVCGQDTGCAQLIEVSFQTENGVTRVTISYRVAGWQFRTPPNQLRREVVKLHTQIVGVRQSAVVTNNG